ncbi:MAG: carbon-nitrogen hydrolase family protein [Bdellovibrionales bacterium]|nr:carbon-nitrogen hydrolase family protein [Bdellovibrionales bacterium]
MEKLKVAVIQLTSSNEIRENETLIVEALKRIEGAGVELVVFPENVWFMRLAEGEGFPDFGSLSSAAFRETLQAWVNANGTAVVLGSVPLGREVGGKPYAATVVFTPGEPWSVPYTKVHLFDVDVAGHRPVRESDHLKPGEGPAVWIYKGWRFGCAICYDVRFSELFSQYAAAGVDALFLPSAFLVPTGRQHWEILVRARAIESQAYMLAPAQSGDHGDRSAVAGAVAVTTPMAAPRKTYGRSMIVDPWGRVLAAASAEKSGVEVLIAELGKEEIAKVRTQIPMKAHRRLAPHQSTNQPLAPLRTQE